MAHKQVLFGSGAREKILRGVGALADAVRVTLGPKSKCVLIAQLLKSARAYGGKQLARLVARAAKAGVRVTPVLREGTPWSEIVRASRAPGVELVVIGTHGRTGLSRLLLGSVASRVVGLARCPVLSVGARGGRQRS